MSQPDIIYSIFISSTQKDLVDYRSRARDIVLTSNMRPINMENFPAESRPTLSALNKYLDDADAVVLIAGATYGSVDVDIGTSYVEWEFSQALARGKPVLRFVMSQEARARYAEQEKVPEKERQRQEEFIERLMDRRLAAVFDDSTFDREVAGALQRLPNQLPKEAGLIRVADHHHALEPVSLGHDNLRAEHTLLRLISGIGLIHKHMNQRGKGRNRSMKPEEDRAALERFMDLLYQDLANRPVIVQSIDTIIHQLIARLHSFSAADGFVPESFDQLEACIDELFGPTLSVLKATSINSNREDLKNYKGYWQDGELGPFFKAKNEEFLKRAGSQRLLRAYVCDSLASAVGEDWFEGTVIPQVRQGASVKIIEIAPHNVEAYEDFGIYEHRSGRNSAGNYLLLAPRSPNRRRATLTTSITANSRIVNEYSKKFDALWQRSARPLELIESPRLDEADRQRARGHGRGCVEDLFGQSIILRKMERLDTRERLFESPDLFVRKYQAPYAKAITDHVREHFPSIGCMVYVGDTHKNDGVVIRNLQSLGWNMAGFICEPSLGIRRLWFNDILYSNRWTDIVGFADKIRAEAGPNMLAIFDIDQTLWAPKGVRDAALTNSRMSAICSLIDDYVTSGQGDFAKRAKNRIRGLYPEISKREYLPLTVDNEDFKAAICVFLSLNLIFTRPTTDKLSGEAPARTFEDFERLETRRFVNYMKTDYLPGFMHPDAADEENITNFIKDTLSTVRSGRYTAYSKMRGIHHEKMAGDLQEIFDRTFDHAPIQYVSFRAMELEETLKRVTHDGDSADQLVLNKPVWDLAGWLKRSGAMLLALSDRPDESTVAPDGRSLLASEMSIYGKDVTGYLAST